MRRDDSTVSAEAWIEFPNGGFVHPKVQSSVALESSRLGTLSRELEFAPETLEKIDHAREIELPGTLRGREKGPPHVLSGRE